MKKFYRDIYEEALINEWPKISFDQLENLEIDNRAVRVFYKSFFFLMRVPKTTFNAFSQVLREKPA